MARRPVERSLEAVEGYVNDFAEDNPHVNVSLLRFSNVIGDDIETPLTRALRLPAVPSLMGFDPRFQFVHEDDVIRAMLFALRHELPGVYNVAGDGLLPWSEVAAICGKRTIPLLPVGTSFMTTPLRLLGVDLPEEYMNLLRYGRGVDNSRLKLAGFEYEYTSAEAVRELRGERPAARCRGSRERLPLREGRRAVLPALPRRCAPHGRRMRDPQGTSARGSGQSRVHPVEVTSRTSSTTRSPITSQVYRSSNSSAVGAGEAVGRRSPVNRQASANVSGSSAIRAWVPWTRSMPSQPTAVDTIGMW